MRLRKAAFLVLLILVTVLLSQALFAQSLDAEREKRLQWWREARFGMFIHWGLYAVPAGEWKGQPVAGIGEWIMNRAKIPVGEYEQLAKQFNPVKFNAEQWVQLAKDAGMKYITITSKHHDGFAMYGSKVSKYNIVDATPFKRDPMKELAAACQKAGIKLCFYYSHAQDWHERDGAGNNWDFPEKRNAQPYLETKVFPQVKEILSGYGKLGLIWFDTPGLLSLEQVTELRRMVKSLQPTCLINSRIGHDKGDYVQTGDNAIPSKVGQDPWETPATINHTWGYKKDDHDWKSPGDVTFKLVDIVSKGGNYLLNVGPMADGVIPQPSQDVLRTVGRWLKVNGEAVYGAGPTPFGEELGEPSATGAKDTRGNPLFLNRNEYRVTTKPGRLYVTLFQEPRMPLALPAMRNAVKRAYQLADGRPVEVKVEDGRALLQILRPIVDPMATVVVVEIEGDEVQR